MTKTLATSVLLGLAVAACGGEKPVAKAPAVAPRAAEASSQPETRQQAAQSGAVQISPDILKACGMSEADAYFPFDSSRLESKDIHPLNTVATCFTGGALKGKALRLVGRADPRGETDYNMTLGQARADSVAGYLSGRGMDKGKTVSTSRGALDAQGHDEAGWARDRRVDLSVGD